MIGVQSVGRKLPTAQKVDITTWGITGKTAVEWIVDEGIFRGNNIATYGDNFEKSLMHIKSTARGGGW